jgi:3-oxoadipate enol-lactonase
MSGNGVQPQAVEARAGDGAALSGTLWQASEGRPRIVLVHSLALDRSVWRYVVPMLTDRADVLAYDCRGHGRSERRPGPYSTRLFGDDLASVLGSVGWREATVVGCSMGGCAVQELAMAHPERVCGLVLIDTTAWYGEQAAASWAQRAEKARAGGMRALVDYQVARWFSPGFREREPGLVDELVEIFVGNDVDCYVATCHMMGAADLRPVLRPTRGPAAVIVGSEDSATPPAMAENLAHYLAINPPIVLDGAQHLTPLERPTEIVASITAVAEEAAATGTGSRRA